MHATGGNGWMACRATVPHRQSNDFSFLLEKFLTTQCYISDIVSRVPSLLSRWTLGLCTVHLAPHRVCPHAALHHPPVHPGYHPPSRRWRGGCSGAARRCMRFARMPAVVPRPHGPSRWCTVFCTAQPGVYRFGPLQTSLLPCGFCRITGPGSRSEPPSDQSGCQSLS